MIVFNTGGIVVICMIITNIKYDLLIFALIIVSISLIRDLHGTKVKNVYSKENKQLIYTNIRNFIVFKARNYFFRTEKLDIR